MATVHQLHGFYRSSLDMHRPRPISQPRAAFLASPLRRSTPLSTPRTPSHITRALPPPPPMGPMGEKFEEDNKKYAELTQAIEAAAATAQEGLQGTSIYLVGMMGSGKSTVGKLVSQALGYCFFDTDALIEQLAGKTIPEIFAEDGEDDFRAIETQVLQELAPFKDCIISTGGGAPTKSVNWGHMQGGISVWLSGPPQLLAHRVLRDGTDNRPLLADKEQESKGESGTAKEEAAAVSAEYEKTVEKLTKLLDDRKEQYSFADIVVSLEGDDPSTADFGAPAAVIAHRVLQAINDRIARDTAMRKERMNFEVVNDNLPPSMRVVQSINPSAEVAESDPYLP